jgi:tetratricopeptide (TPR) repeat protein
MRSVEKALALLVLFALGSSLAFGQLSAEEQKEAATAQSLYDTQNFVAALPLYEDLHQRQPASTVYTERLAMSLVGSAGNHPLAEQLAILDRARRLLLDAKAAGDNSNLLQIMLEKLNALSASVKDQANSPAPAGPPSPGADAFQRAEKAFSSGKLSEAVTAYQEAFAADPKMYAAPLYAGDSEFKQGHYKEADEWYAKAVAVDPDRETAYRYWGDCLMKQGDSTQAVGKFIDAIVAEPYAKTPRVGLKQWADATKAMFASPPIQLPARPTSGGKDKNGKDQININIDSSALGNPASSAVLAYSMNAALWQGDKFHQAFPNERQYRHSLAEERDSIQVALSVLKEQKIKPDKLDPTWKWLLQLDKDGMLDAWILLDNPDQGIAQDYAAYRATHRDLLHAYIAKYDVHPK